jgi:hypothetical protein
VQNIKYKSTDQHATKRATPYHMCVLPVVPAWLATTYFQKFMPIQDILRNNVERIL